MSACQRIEQPTPVVYADDTHGFGDGGRTAGEFDGGSPAATAATRRATCLHEAAHATIAVILGDAVEYVSVRSGKHFRGIAVPPVRHERPEADRFAPWHPVCMQPPELRADVERSILVFLAGDLAALYLTPPQTSYVDEDVEEIARRALDNLGPRLAELVVGHEESDGPFDDDDTKAVGLASAFAGPQAGVFYLAWLRAEARELVLRYQAAIRRVGDALERHAVLRGDEVAALVHPSRKEEQADAQSSAKDQA